MSKLVIKESEWMHGRGQGWLFAYGQKCCLGFFGEQFCGLSDAQMEAVGLPCSPKVIEAPWPEWLVNRGFAEEYDGTGLAKGLTTAGLALAELNDEPDIDDDFRKAEITRIFKENGVDVEFIP